MALVDSMYMYVVTNHIAPFLTWTNNLAVTLGMQTQLLVLAHFQTETEVSAWGVIS